MDELFLDEKMEDVRSFAWLGGKATVFSTRSPDKDTANEDAAALLQFSEDSGLAVVCDGAGGMPAGEEAAATIIRELIGHLDRVRKQGGSMRGAILDGIEAANRALLARGQGSASTCSAVEIDAGRIRAFQVGDSTILVCGQRGKLKYQTVAHSPVGFAVLSGLLDESEAVHHEDRHLVSNLVGTEAMRIEVGSDLNLTPRDTLLIASDGVFDNLYLSEIIDLIRKGPLEEAARGLAEQSLERMRGESAFPSKPDDLSFILFRAENSARKSAKTAPEAD